MNMSSSTSNWTTPYCPCTFHLSFVVYSFQLGVDVTLRLKSTDGLEALESLDILDLHGNQIAALTGVSRLRALRVLNLAANSLKKLPSLDGLIALEELNAKRNRIAKIVPEVAHARRLERLYLSNNEMRR